KKVSFFIKIPKKIHFAHFANDFVRCSKSFFTLKIANININKFHRLSTIFSDHNFLKRKK
ncbi:hypothetical protein DVA85_23385, partial [Acinetobacter sp. RIT592]